jgi:hypothetical protein
MAYTRQRGAWRQREWRDCFSVVGRVESVCVA